MLKCNSRANTHPTSGRPSVDVLSACFYWLNLTGKNGVTAPYTPPWKASFQSQVIFESYVSSESGRAWNHDLIHGLNSASKPLLWKTLGVVTLEIPATIAGAIA